jgi:hypothetical protein
MSKFKKMSEQEKAAVSGLVDEVFSGLDAVAHNAMLSPRPDLPPVACACCGQPVFFWTEAERQNIELVETYRRVINTPGLQFRCYSCVCHFLVDEPPGDVMPTAGTLLQAWITNRPDLATQ